MTIQTHNPVACAVIIGRAGSKGLPGKNERTIAGQPIVACSIDHARSAATVGRIIVSTDSGAIARSARDLDVEVVDRPAEFATDTATVDAPVRHAVETAAVEQPVIVILYANVPIRPDDLIDRAVRELLTSGADSVQSYASVGKHHPHWMAHLDPGGRVRPNVDCAIYRRQELPELFIPDGGVIAVTRESLFNIGDHPHAFLGDDRRGIQNKPGDVIDIDDEFDLLVAEARLERTQAIPA